MMKISRFYEQKFEMPVVDEPGGGKRVLILHT